MEFSLSEIWLQTLYSQGPWPHFGTTLKIHKKSNFDQNQLKVSIQHECIKKFNENEEFFWQNLAKDHVL